MASGAAASAVFVGPVKSLRLDSLMSPVEGIKNSVKWAMDFVKLPGSDSLELVPTPIPVETNAVAVRSEPSPEMVAEAPVTVAPITPAPPPAALEEPVKPVAPVKPRRRRRRVRKAPVAAAKAAPASLAPVKKAAVKSDAALTDGLIGTYVSLKLKTGRDVKGVLQARTANEYTVEIPGMGPFKYPASNVLSVGPAE